MFSKKLLCIMVLVTAVGSAMSSIANAKNYNPSSGRSLQSGHWLTCYSDGGAAVRTDPLLDRNTPDEVVQKYVPEFRGKYGFEVKDTWEEWVTHSGTSCMHCGE